MSGYHCARTIININKTNIIFKNELLNIAKRNCIHVKNINTSSTSNVVSSKVEAEAKQQSRIHELIQEFYRDEAVGGVVPTFKKALIYADKIAIEDELGEHSYAKLYGASKTLSIKLSAICGSGSEAKIAFLCENNFNYIVAQWACWLSGLIAVPLNDKSPPSLLEYFVKDSEAEVLVGIPKYEDILTNLAKKINKEVVIIEPSYLTECKNKGLLDKASENVLKFGDTIIVEGCQFGNFYKRANALILYTSGSTGPPKGVVITHKNIHSQINCLTRAWKWHPTDTILHTLPLNHTHGIINALLCPLDVGAKIIMRPKFDAAEVWQYLSGQKASKPNIFMGVPTMYTKLIESHQKKYENKVDNNVKNYCLKNIRLMVSGSAPLTATVFDNWYKITGHKLLERYGMTEIGMALSNPYIENEKYKRQIGTVGYPLPGVELKLVKFEGDDMTTLVHVKGKVGEGPWADCGTGDFLYLFNREDNETATEAFLKNSQSNTPIQKPSIDELIDDDERVINTELPFEPLAPQEPVVGEIIVQGPTIFKEYYNKVDQTYSEFIEVDWFKTGDTALYDRGVFKIDGRTSVDIIKSGGYKISALDVENCLIEHADIKDCAVIGLPDEKWGQKIVSLVVVAKGKKLNQSDIDTWASAKLPKYSIPKQIIEMDEIPRNPMGKVNKKEIIKTLIK